jgi:hypothetical protein
LAALRTKATTIAAAQELDGLLQDHGLAHCRLQVERVRRVREEYDVFAALDALDARIAALQQQGEPRGDGTLEFS